MKIIKRILIIVPIICGIAVFVFMKANKQAPVRAENKERMQTVRVMDIELTDVVPRVAAYGYVAPDRAWQAIPEVSGKVIYVHENLKKGHFIKKGEILLQIDTTAYGLAESRGKADLMNIDARLKELDQSEKNTRRLLEIEKKSLTSAGQELERKRELFKNGYISASDLEREERTFLSHQTAVNNLQNSLDLLPSQKNALLAQKKSGESTVSQQQLDVAKTQIVAPFNCRLSKVNIELYQFAAAGSVIAEAISIDRVEIPVSLTPKDFFTLLPKDYNYSIGQTPDVETIRRAMSISATVQLPMDDHHIFEWEGQFSRTSEAMDTKTGAITVYITVENPYDKAIPGKRPPLVSNMYVKAILYGKSVNDRYVVPRSAIHDNSLYICNADNRLEIRPVEVDFFMMDTAVLKSGLSQGEKIVLSDLIPAIEGMLLNPVPDKAAANRIKKQVSERKG